MRSAMKSMAMRGERGFTLIEVLIAVLVLSVGLLGLAALQATALRNNQSSLQRSAGVVYTYSIIESMHANVDAARAGTYNMGRICTVPAGGTLIQNDQRQWMRMLQQNLGADACGAIACASDLCKVTVEWNDSRAKEGDAAQTFSTEVRL